MQSKLRSQPPASSSLPTPTNPRCLSTASPRQRHDQTGSGGGDARDSAGIDSVWPAVLRQMEQWITTDQRYIASAGTMDVVRLAVRHQRLCRHLVRLLASAGQFGGGQCAQIVARRLYRELAADGPDIGVVMYPDGAPCCNWRLPAGAAGHELVETEMTEFVAAVGGKDHIAEGRGGDLHVA